MLLHGTLPGAEFRLCVVHNAAAVLAGGCLVSHAWRVSAGGGGSAWGGSPILASSDAAAGAVTPAVGAGHPLHSSLWHRPYRAARGRLHRSRYHKPTCDSMFFTHTHMSQAQSRCLHLSRVGVLVQGTTLGAPTRMAVQPASLPHSTALPSSHCLTGRMLTSGRLC